MYAKEVQRFWRYYGGFLLIPAYLLLDAGFRAGEITNLRDELVRLQPGFERLLAIDGPRCGTFRSSENAAAFPEGERFAVPPEGILATVSHPSERARFRSDRQLCGRIGRRFGTLPLWDFILIPPLGQQTQ